MSATRASIAAAVSTVPGVKCHPRRPTSPQVGDAYPLIGSFDRGRGLSFSRTWRLILWLGQDEKEAEKKLDELLLPIAEALQPVAHVDGAIPFIVKTEGGDVFAVEFTARSE
jgi:hypothetical protein